MACHHIDWDGLQITVNTMRGQSNPTYHCLLCNTDFNPEQYSDVIKSIREKKKNNTLTFYRTPKGKTHTEEECVDKRKCDIHEEDQNGL